MDPMQRVNQTGSELAAGYSGVDQFQQLMQWLKNLIPANSQAADPNAALVASPGQMAGVPGAQPTTRGQLQGLMAQRALQAAQQQKQQGK